MAKSLGMGIPIFWKQPLDLGMSFESWLAHPWPNQIWVPPFPQALLVIIFAYETGSEEFNVFWSAALIGPAVCWWWHSVSWSNYKHTQIKVIAYKFRLRTGFKNQNTYKEIPKKWLTRGWPENETFLSLTCILAYLLFNNWSAGPTT